MAVETTEMAAMGNWRWACLGGFWVIELSERFELGESQINLRRGQAQNLRREFQALDVRGFPFHEILLL